MMETEEFIGELIERAGAAGVDLSRDQAALCLRHADAMLQWNARINLTRVTRPRDVLVKHILDSILPVPWLFREGFLPVAKGAECNVLDVGTGPGYPGIPLKIVRPRDQFVLLDGNRKKVSFLTVVINQLGLSGIRAVQGRFENPEDSWTGAGPFHLIVMRAVRPEPVLFKCVRELLARNGIFAWWAGPEADLNGVSRDAEGHGLDLEADYPYELPLESSSRRLITWRKNS